MTIFWFRRDLRLFDNTALHYALENSREVQPIFIFDSEIIDELENDDPRVNFLYDELFKINTQLNKLNSSLKIYKGKPLKIISELISSTKISSLYINKDYEPYAIKRDNEIANLLKEKQISFHTFKDQVIFEENEVVKNDGLPYTVFTPFKNKWLQNFNDNKLVINTNSDNSNFKNSNHLFPSKEEIGLIKSSITVPNFDVEMVSDYDKTRNFPGLDATSKIGPHLRFGTLSIRQIVEKVIPLNDIYLSELIWREFFMQILWHFPKVVHQNFRSKYDGIKWRNDEDDFQKWCKGETGYPFVDAGMRELNKTGFMHNRVRMITASFLCKHLLIDWRWGEKYFALKLNDYEMASNVGNWQWASGSGVDAAPYFRIFNPHTQIQKFDKKREYIGKWINEDSENYPDEIIDHKFARLRCLNTYKKYLD